MEKDPITNKLNKLKNFYQRRGRMPGYKEMLGLFDFRSKNAVYKLINRFVDNGTLRKETSGKISPGERWGDLKLLGSIQAGIPEDVVEEELETISLDTMMVDRPENSYLLIVSGDSMIDAGIHEGDLVLIEKTENAKLHDIVVADIDGEWTLKYFEKNKRGHYLKAANKKYQDIYPEESLSIGGVVRGFIRRYF